MHIKNLYLRTRKLIVEPGNEFMIISRERRRVAAINSEVILPYALSVAFFALLGSLFQHLGTPRDAFLFILLDAVIVFLIVLLQVYLSGLIVVPLARRMDITGSRREAYALVAYAEIPFFIILAVVKLFPSLIFLIFLGMYTFRVLYAGIDALFRKPEHKKVQFFLLSSLVMVIMFILLSELFSFLYSEIISQIATFALL